MFRLLSVLLLGRLALQEATDLALQLLLELLLGRLRSLGLAWELRSLGPGSGLAWELRSLVLASGV